MHRVCHTPIIPGLVSSTFRFPEPFPKIFPDPFAGFLVKFSINPSVRVARLEGESARTRQSGAVKPRSYGHATIQHFGCSIVEHFKILHAHFLKATLKNTVSGSASLKFWWSYKLTSGRKQNHSYSRFRFNIFENCKYSNAAC